VDRVFFNDLIQIIAKNINKIQLAEVRKNTKNIIESNDVDMKFTLFKTTYTLTESHFQLDRLGTLCDYE
jgi:hypothetical protein